MMRLFRANEARRAEIAEILARRLAGDRSVRFAFLHGSFQEDLGFHDIDIALSLSSEGRGHETDVALALASDLSRVVGVPVDVRVLECAPVTFRFHALRGRLLCSRDDDAVAALMEDTMRRYFDLAPMLRRATADLLAT